MFVCVFSSLIFICFFQKVHHDGYVSLNTPFYGRWPRPVAEAVSARKKLAGFGLFAPLWALSEPSVGNVFYHVYDTNDDAVDDAEKARVQRVIARARADVTRYSTDTDPDPRWLAVVTWENLLPVSHLQQDDKVAH